MDNRSKFWRGVMVGVLVTAFACLVTVGTSAGIYMFGRRVIDNQVQVQAEQGNSGAEASADGQAGNQTLDMERVNRKLTELQTIIDKKYLFEDKVEVEKEESGIYNGFLFGLNDPYAVYYTPEELASFMDETNGSYCGIGAMVSQDRKTGVSTIIRVFEGSPAEKAGIRPGDIIFAVGDTEVTGMDLTIMVNNYIKGEEDTNVEITVYREDTGEYVDLTVTRKPVN